jgi:hypothetical protein
VTAQDTRGDHWEPELAFPITPTPTRRRNAAANPPVPAADPLGSEIDSRQEFLAKEAKDSFAGLLDRDRRRVGGRIRAAECY